MTISPSAIFHFTNNKDSLKGILESNFKIKYCKETIKFGNRRKFSIYVPMVSFCDIPLSQVKDHIGRYGSYGLGLTREWAIRKQLNPVIYIQPNSLLFRSYDQGMAYFSKLKSKDRQHSDAYMRFFDLVRYMKPYEGELIRKIESIEKYRFSDEREWRYVPPINENYGSYYLESKFEDGFFRERAQAEISHLRLEFEPDDIKYIIIKDESEIREFVRHLSDVKGGKFSYHGIERLTTRIITSEQIKLDF
jgi:hypothetical protein